MSNGVSGTPRWVKVFVAIAAVVVLLIVVALLSGQDHGPGRHSSIPASAVVPTFG